MGGAAPALTTPRSRAPVSGPAEMLVTFDRRHFDAALATFGNDARSPPEAVRQVRGLLEGILASKRTASRRVCVLPKARTLLVGDDGIAVGSPLRGR